MIVVVMLRLAYVIARGLVGGLVLVAWSDAAKEVESSCCATHSRSCNGRPGVPRLTWIDWVVTAALTLRLSPARRVGLLVAPGRILGWQRRLVAR